MQLASIENESEIGNDATCRCDRRGATRGSWVCGPIVGSLFVGCGFAVRGLVGSPFVGSWVRATHCSWVRATRYSWVRRSRVDDLAGGATISTFLGSRSLSLSLSLSLCLRV